MADQLKLAGVEKMAAKINKQRERQKIADQAKLLTSTMKTKLPEERRVELIGLFDPQESLF